MTDDDGRAATRHGKVACAARVRRAAEPRPARVPAAGIAISLAVALALAAGGAGCTRAAPPPVRAAELTAGDAVLEARLAELDASVRDDPGDAHRWARLAKTYHVHEMAALAETCYAQALALDDGEARWWWLRAVAAESAGRIDDALAHAARASARVPDYAPARATVARWLVSHGRLDEALVEALRATEIAKDDAGSWLVLASVRLERGEYAEGDACARKALRLPMSRPRQKAYAHFVLGGCLRGLGRGDEARIEIARGRDGDARFPVDDPWRNELVEHQAGFRTLAAAARGDVEAGRFAEVLPFLEQLRARDPSHAQVTADLGRCYRETNRLDESERVLAEGAEKHPEIPAMWSELALTKERRGRQAEALDVLCRGITKLPRAGELWEVQGLVHMRLGNAGEALRNFEQAFAVEPDRPWVLIHGAVAELERGDVDAAERWLRRCGEKDPGLPDLWAAMSIASARRGARDDAVRRLKVSLWLGDRETALQAAAKEEVAALAPK